MDDPHSRAYGLAHSAILVELLKALLQHERLSPIEVRTLLAKAERAVAAHSTDTAAAAEQHIKMIGEAVGVVREGAVSAPP